MPIKDPQKLKEYQRVYRAKNKERLRELRLGRASNARKMKCACGMVSITIKQGSPVCSRCDRLEHQRGDNE
jgi:hypothetical protein